MCLIGVNFVKRWIKLFFGDKLGTILRLPPLTGVDNWHLPNFSRQMLQNIFDNDFVVNCF